MSVTLTAPSTPAPQIDLAAPFRKRWTREECSQLERYGFLKLEQYELVEGELIRKVPKNLPHMQALALLMEWLIGIFGGTCAIPEPEIDVSPEDTPTSAPEPDAVVLKRSIRELSDSIRPIDIHLLGEVSNSTLAFDLGTKAALYARAEIPEYWVVDINARRIIIHREPSEGRYRSIVAYAEDELVSCLAAPDVRKRVGELL